MITKATEKDIQYILDKLAELENPPNEKDYSIARLINDPNEYIFVDKEADTLCKCSIMPERQEVCVVWLLPGYFPKSILAEILYETCRTLLKERPKLSTYYFYGAGSTGAGCFKEFTDFGAGRKHAEEWAEFFPNVGTVKGNWLPLYWEIGGALGDMVKSFTNVGIDGTEALYK